MMRYEEFKNIVKIKIREYLPTELSGCEITYQKITKVNEEKDGILFSSPNMASAVSPTIYMDDMYKTYLQTGDFDEAMEHTFRGLEKAINEGNELYQMVDFANARGSILCQVVNTEQNQELLLNVPHRQFEDLSILYRYIITIKKEQGMLGTVLITYDVANMIGMSECELYQEAMKTMKDTVRTSIKPMSQAIEELTGSRVIYEEEQENMPRLYVITNAVLTFGAANILDTEKMQQLAEEIDSDLYLFPSSIHEFLAVKAGTKSIGEWLQVIYENNMMSVEAEERLSNNLYFYNKTDGKISILGRGLTQELVA